MAHRTLIGGTAYEITGGRTLVDGTGYSIPGGRTLIGGTGYDVSFLVSCIVTVNDGSGWFDGSWSALALYCNGSQKKETFEAAVGDTVSIYNAYTNLSVTLNGTALAKDSDRYHTFTLTGDAVIDTSGVQGAYGQVFGTITITMTE